MCDPRQNRLLKSGNKDRVDGNKLAQLLRGGLLNAVYHGENSTRTMKELAHLTRLPGTRTYGLMVHPMPSRSACEPDVRLLARMGT